MNPLVITATGVVVAQMSKLISGGLELSPEHYIRYRNGVDKIRGTIEELDGIDLTRPMSVAGSIVRYIDRRIGVRKVKKEAPVTISKETEKSLVAAAIEILESCGVGTVGEIKLHRVGEAVLPPEQTVRCYASAVAHLSDSGWKQEPLGGLLPVVMRSLGVKGAYMVVSCTHLATTSDTIDKTRTSGNPIFTIHVMATKDPAAASRVQLKGDVREEWRPSFNNVTTSDDKKFEVVFSQLYTLVPENVYVENVLEEFWGECKLRTAVEPRSANGYGFLGDATWAITPAITLRPENSRPFVGPQLSVLDEWDAYLKSGEPVTVMLTGKPGGGKTTLSKTAIDRFKDKRTLIMSNQLFQDLNATAWDVYIKGYKPDIVVIDDIDRVDPASLALSLYKLDRQNYKVPLTILSANDINRMPPAAYRAGRVDYVLKIDASTTAAEQTIQTILRQRHVAEGSVSAEAVRALGERLSGRTPAEIEKHVTRALVLGWDAPACEYDMDLRTTEDLRDPTPSNTAGNTVPSAVAPVPTAAASKPLRRAKPQITYQEE